MKYIFLLLLSLSLPALAVPLSAAMESENGNVSISFNDYENATGFENYKCLIVYNRSWEYKLSATKQSDGSYKCQDQGVLQSGVYYEVIIEFEDRPNMNITHSPMLLLKVI